MKNKINSRAVILKNPSRHYARALAFQKWERVREMNREFLEDRCPNRQHHSYLKHSDCRVNDDDCTIGRQRSRGSIVDSRISYIRTVLVNGVGAISTRWRNGGSARTGAVDAGHVAPLAEAGVTGELKF